MINAPSWALARPRTRLVPLVRNSLPQRRSTLPQHRSTGSLRIFRKRESLVIKRGEKGGQRHDDLSCRGGAEMQAASFAPFSSARTPSITSPEERVTAMNTLPTLSHRRPVNAGIKPDFSLLNKQAKAAHRNDYTEPMPKYHRIHNHGDQPTDYEGLPRVTLIHPSLAGKPRSDQARPANEAYHGGMRQCSLGCRQEIDGDICIERRLNSSKSAPSTKPMLLDNPLSSDDANAIGCAAKQQAQRSLSRGKLEKASKVAPAVCEILVTASVGVLDACRHVQLPTFPRFETIDTLTAEDTTPQQKSVCS